MGSESLKLVPFVAPTEARRRHAIATKVGQTDARLVGTPKLSGETVVQSNAARLNRRRPPVGHVGRVIKPTISRSCPNDGFAVPSAASTYLESSDLTSLQSRIL